MKTIQKRKICIQCGRIVPKYKTCSLYCSI